MLFPEEDAPMLKAWIVKRIEDTSNADAEVLAEYIIALLKHDGDKASVRALCEQEIPDFLTEDPKLFLDDVFQAIAYKSYLPGAAPAPKLQPPRPNPQPTEIDTAPNVSHSGSKKRSYNDRDDADPSGDQDVHHNGGRPNKHQRRRGRGRGDDRRGDFSAMGMPPFDPQNPAAMEAFMAMTMQFPGMGQFLGSGSRGGQQRRRGRCRDFDAKGYCSRGTSCMFDHGNESLYMPPSMPQGDDYEPDQPMLPANLFPFLNPFSFNPETNRGRGGRKGARGGRKGGGRAAFSAEGPVNDRSKTAIVVENIPDESLSEPEVRKFFTQFGDIVEVSVKPSKHLAIVKYDQWSSANAAYQSPKVIFDNRFVKVFWHKDEGHAGNGPIGSGVWSSDHDKQDAENDGFDMDPEEFQRRQEEAQKKFQERESKKLELERQRQEVEKKRQELMQKQREETERLQAKLLKKNGGVPETPSTGADMLRAKIASLEEEAKILGLDPNAAEDDMSARYPPRGGYRGRSTFRGRATRGWRGGRGSFMGVDGRHAAYAQYSIDNRPKRLAISGVDFTATDKDESLRHFLLSLGEFESVEPSTTTTFVSFRDRKTAEKLYNSLHGNELPGVEGKLELSWVNTPLPPVVPPQQQDKDRDDAMAGMDDDRTSAPQHTRAAQQLHEDIDYDQAGDDDDAY